MVSRVVNVVVERVQDPLSTDNYRGALARAFEDMFPVFRQRHKATPGPSQRDVIAKPARAVCNGVWVKAAEGYRAPLEAESLEELSRLVREAMRTPPR